MNHAGQLLLFITIILWATIIGGITYSHVAFLPSFLLHLPESTVLVKGEFPIREDIFWRAIHPMLILSLILTIVFNWRWRLRRTFLFVAFFIYALVLISTFTYFVPNLLEFAESQNSSIPAEEWQARGKMWQTLSIIRGIFMYFGFVMLLLALVKKEKYYEKLGL